MRKKALLIQPINEFLVQILPAIVKEYNQHHCGTMTLLEFIRWFICRKLHTIYNLNIYNYIHRDSACELIYYKVEQSLGSNDSTFTHYIKAPKIYSENLINVIVLSDQLLIEYFTDE